MESTNNPSVDDSGQSAEQPGQYVHTERLRDEQGPDSQQSRLDSSDTTAYDTTAEAGSNALATSSLEPPQPAEHPQGDAIVKQASPITLASRLRAFSSLSAG